jgi:tRNA nucleotidyltransferase (CCA-adding enzyme)
MYNETAKPAWQHFPHKADIGIRGIAATKQQAFEQAAIALTAVITNPENIEPLKKIKIKCSAPDDELLLADWLNSLLFEMDTKNMLFCQFEVNIDQNNLTATAWGQQVDIAKHQPAVEVKAATYTCLSVKKDNNGNWIAQCVVDV